MEDSCFFLFQENSMSQMEQPPDWALQNGKNLAEPYK